MDKTLVWSFCSCLLELHHPNTQQRTHTYIQIKGQRSHACPRSASRGRGSHLKRDVSSDAGTHTVSNVLCQKNLLYRLCSFTEKGLRRWIDQVRSYPLLIGQLVSEKAAVVLTFIITVYGEQSGLGNWSIFFIFVSFLHALKTQHRPIQSQEYCTTKELWTVGLVKTKLIYLFEGS